MVVTAVERGGRARAKKGGTHRERTIATFLFGNVSLDSVLSTDELPAYCWIWAQVSGSPAGQPLGWCIRSHSSMNWQSPWSRKLRH
jgi:hypothetical protein